MNALSSILSKLIISTLSTAIVYLMFEDEFFTKTWFIAFFVFLLLTSRDEKT